MSMQLSHDFAEVSGAIAADSQSVVQFCLLPAAIRRETETGWRAEVCGSAVQSALFERARALVSACRDHLLQPGLIRPTRSELLFSGYLSNWCMQGFVGPSPVAVRLARCAGQ